MSNQKARWTRGVLLALPCAALYWASIPYHASYFGVSFNASLAHLTLGYMLAVGMLYADPLPLILCVVFRYAMWMAMVAMRHAAAVAVDHNAATDYVFGLYSIVVTYALLRLALRWMGWPRSSTTFRAADMPAFVLFGLILLPALMALSTLTGNLLLTEPLPSVGRLASEALQVLLAKFFGVLVLALPLILLGTHHARSTNARIREWWLMLVTSVLVPVLLLRLAPYTSVDESMVLGVLLDNRLLIAGVLVWAALKLPLRWSMAMFAFAQLLLAAGLARHAGEAVHLPALADLCRIAAECIVLQLLVLLLMLYSKERDAAAGQHERDSLTDPATGLPNLAALRLRCATLVPPLGMLLLDRTDKIAASMGLAAQAALMRWIASRLQGVAQVYSIGNGQLVLAGIEPSTAVDWDDALERLHRADFVWIGQRVRVLPYLGVAGADPVDESLGMRLQRAAHAAMDAKQRGEPHWLAADRDEGAETWAARQRSLALSSVVFSRIRTGEVELYFQPIVPLGRASNTVSGEVLCRLRDEGGHLVMPDQFLPELLENRRMAELDLAMMRRLGQWVAEHRAQLPAIGYFSVNIAGQSLSSREFARELLALIDGFPLPAAQLCFEITETAAIVHAQESARLFEQLRERGCHIAIDDFGVGYQSFERLKQIPVDLIKIDGSFVRNMRNSPRDLEVVRASVRLARAFGAQTAAEFVGDAETAELLRRLRVDWMQGHYVGAARPIETLLALTFSPSDATQMVWHI